MMNRNLIVMGVGALVVAAVSFFQLSSYRKNKKKSPPNTDREVYTEEQMATMEDRVLYINDIDDDQQYSLIVQQPALHPDIDSLRYQIILNINKGTAYEGVVKIKTISYKKNGNKSHLYIDFAGKTILYLSVNGRRLEEDQVKYHRHRIFIKRDLLNREQNNIEIIFYNKYAFMGDGLTSYFPLDEHNKYSLKGQMIYSRNSAYQVPRLFPCLNITNPCEIKLDVIHPDSFEAFSNTPKSLVRVCSKQNYPLYSFFFQGQQLKMNRSFKMNTTGFMENSSIKSYEEVIKSNTQFYDARLSSIHDFFVVCSAITEVRPSNANIIAKDLLIRYYVKDHLVSKSASLLNILNYSISEIFSRIEKFKLERHYDYRSHQKIDIFFVDDIKAEGDFYVGAIFLNQSTINRGVIDRRMFYLLCRSFVGMGMVEKGGMQFLTLRGKFRLNELTLQIFPECVDFIYVKQKQYEHIRNNCIELSKETKGNDLEFFIQEYYEKQCRYFVNSLNEEKVSNNVHQLMEKLINLPPDEYWTNFTASYQFLEPTVAQAFIKISIKEKGIPKQQAELNFAKEFFVSSKYYLKFFTNEEIQSNLKRFSELKSYGLEKRIPYIKMKEKYLGYITPKMEKYLSMKSNKLEAKKLYDQFKRYNQGRNFHHISALRREIKRIKILAKESVMEQRIDLECGLVGWKNLIKLEIYPENEQTREIVVKLENMKTHDPE